MTFDGGAVENVVLSNLTIDTVRYEWFWLGGRRALPLQHPEAERGPRQLAAGEGPAGRGHPQRQDPERRRPRPRVECLQRPPRILARRRVLRERQVDRRARPQCALRQGCPRFAVPPSPRSAAARRRGRLGGAGLGQVGERPGFRRGRRISSSTASGASRRRAVAAAPAILLNQATRALIRGCWAAPGTGTFLLFTGEGTRDILLERNDLRPGPPSLCVRGTALLPRR